MIAQIEGGQANRPARLLVFLGVVWMALAVGLLIYQLSNPPAIKIEWDTATEIDAAGFYLYRSQSPDGAFVPVNEEMIPSQGDAQTGATYEYTDREVLPGETYYYLLEEVEFDSSTNRYVDDIFSYSVPSSWWVNLISAGSALAGLALLVAGMKEQRNQ